MGCDYFEVVFLYNGTAVSGQWKIGERAMINGVERTTPIDYSNVSDGLLPAGQGSAILLAGKSDRTLMAIGKLPAGTVIDQNTKSVTFEVAAIKTGVSETLSESSFLTAAVYDATGNPNYSNVSAAYTETVQEDIEHLYFLAFKLKRGISGSGTSGGIKAEYTFRLDYSGTTNTAGLLSTYLSNGGLRVSAAGTVEKKHPSYTDAQGYNINANALIILDKDTLVTMETNQTPGAIFNPVVRFSFDTSNTASGSIFALVFEIPVYPLGKTDYKWYIKPGYGVLKYELDEGRGGIGGAVLIKTGEVAPPSISTDYMIEIKKSPRKWRYRWASPTPSGETPDATYGTPPNDYTFVGTAEYDRIFRIGGLKVELQYATGSNKGEPVTDYHTSSVVSSTGEINNDELIFIIGKERVIPYEKLPPGYTLPDEFYGLIEVTVRFTDMRSGVSSDDFFFILVSGHYSGGGNNSTIAFDYADPVYMITGNVSAQSTSNCIYTVLANHSSDPNVAVNGFEKAVSEGVINKLRVVRLSGSFDMNNPALNVGANGTGESTLIMIVAINDDIILGRQSATGGGSRILVRGDRASLASFYFGTWPFAGLPRSPSSLEDTRSFSVSSAATYSAFSSLNYSNKMIVDGGAQGMDNGGLYKVLLDTRYYAVNPSDPPRKKGVDVSYTTILH